MGRSSSDGAGDAPGGGRPRGRAAAAPAPRAVSDARPVADDGRPTLILDVMDTIVSDPFFEHMPRFFSLSFHELLAAKHPTAWIEFEKDEISEEQLFEKFFKDGRGFDGRALVQHMVDHYRYVDGMRPLLERLAAAGYAVHAMSNYPVWWRHIEAKLGLSDYVEWSFVSCEGPMRGLRKPSPDSYRAVTSTLGLPPSRLIFVDDRAQNVDAAAALGWGAVHFKGAAHLEEELRARGLEF